MCASPEFASSTEHRAESETQGASAETAISIPGLVGTGYVAGGSAVAAPGSIDGNFKLVSCPSGSCPNQPYVTLQGDLFPGPWLPRTSSAQWIGPAMGGEETGIDPVGMYDYRETFDLTGLDLSTVSVIGSFAADNGASLQLNGVPVGPSSSSYMVWTSFTISSGFKPGVNTIDFLVSNLVGGYFNPSGLIVELSGTASPLPTTTSLVASPATLVAGEALTLTGTVQGTGNIPPTGAVGFLKGNTLLASATLDVSGVAASTIYPAAGVYSIVAGYQGDRANAQSESTPVTVTVYAGPPSFAITTSGPLTLETEHHGSVTVTVTPQNGFSGAVTLGCGALPQYLTCEWGSSQESGAQLQVSQKAATVELEIDTSAVLGYESSKRSLGPQGVSFALPALCLMLIKRRRLRFDLVRVALCGLALCVAGSLSGCSTKYPSSTQPGTYGIAILGACGGVQNSGNLELIVTK